MRVASSGSQALALRLADATCATSRPDPDGALAAMADAIVARTNAARAESGLPPLARSSCLDEIAWKHSAALAALGEPGSPTPGWPHVLDGVGPRDRVVAAGFVPTQVRENVFDHWASANGEPRFDDAALPELATTWWLESPPHRESLLASDVAIIGVGVVRISRGDRGEYWATQLFSAEP